MRLRADQVDVRPLLIHRTMLCQPELMDSRIGFDHSVGRHQSRKARLTTLRDLFPRGKRAFNVLRAA